LEGEMDIYIDKQEALYDPFDASGSTTIKSLSEYIQIFELFTHNKNLAKDVHIGHFDVSPEDYPRIEGLLKPNYILRGEHSDFGDTATTSGAFRSSTPSTIIRFIVILELLGMFIIEK